MSVTEARKQAKVVLGDVARGLDPNSDERLRPTHTFLGFIDEIYGPWVVTDQKTGKQTIKRLKTAFKGLLELNLQDIGPWHLEKWRIEQGRSEGTCYRELAALKSALSKATEWKLLHENPLNTVKLKRAETNPRIRYLDRNEEERLLQALDAREARVRSDRKNANQWRAKYDYKQLPSLRRVGFVDHLKPMVLLSLNTGMRRGEVFNLEWKDVDFDRAMLTVRGENTKNGRTRYIPMNRTSLSVLKTWQRQSTRNGYVFVSPRGGKVASVHTAWRNLLEEAGITDFRWHDMRHDFASKLVMRGCDINVVRELLGHTTLKVTLIYAHLAPKNLADAVRLLDNFPVETVATQYECTDDELSL